MNGLQIQRGRGDGISLAIRRLETHRAHRDRTVYVAEAFRPAVEDGPSTQGRANTRRGRLAALSHHDPYSPLVGLVLRPVTDAATTIQILLRRW
jgi:hypothetical protein